MNSILAEDSASKKRIGELFWSKILFSANGCWQWTASLSTNGYGRIVFQKNKKTRTFKAHRIAYELITGPIPDGLTLDHICRNRWCVNPDHLEAVTQKENLYRGSTQTAINAAKTHCIRGHPLSGRNLYISNGWRQCRSCYRLRTANSRAKKRALLREGTC